jgi:hypothetical protein
MKPTNPLLAVPAHTLPGERGTPSEVALRRPTFGHSGNTLRKATFMLAVLVSLCFGCMRASAQTNNGLLHTAEVLSRDVDAIDRSTTNLHQMTLSLPTPEALIVGEYLLNATVVRVTLNAAQSALLLAVNMTCAADRKAALIAFKESASSTVSYATIMLERENQILPQIKTAAALTEATRARDAILKMRDDLKPYSDSK